MNRIGKVLIDFNQIEDALALGDTTIVSSILKACGAAIDQGAIVLLRREHSDIPPQELAVFKTREELDNWKSKLNDIQRILKGGVID